MSSIYFLSTLDMFKKDIDYAHLISSGRVKYGENKYEDSIEDFTKAIKKIPNFIDAYIWRGMANFKFKKYADSIEDFNKSIDRIPTIESNPFSFLAYFHRGNVKFALKDYQGAMVDFNKAKDLVYAAKEAGVDSVKFQCIDFEKWISQINLYIDFKKNIKKVN